VRLAGPPPGAARLLLHVRLVLAAATVVPGIFIFRPSSRDLRQGKRFSKQGDLDHAAAAYRRVAGSGRRGEVPEGAFRLGCVLLRQGDQDGAGIAFQLAIESGDPRIVPAAAFNLGHLLELQGHTEGARAAYEQVIGIRGARHAARAACRLGDVLQQKGDTEGARAAYRRAIAHGPPEVREAAALALAELDGTQDGE
jgi:tetratricopeptide (TPR) repeat protein